MCVYIHVYIYIERERERGREREIGPVQGHYALSICLQQGFNMWPFMMVKSLLLLGQPATTTVDSNELFLWLHPAEPCCSGSISAHKVWADQGDGFSGEPWFHDAKLDGNNWKWVMLLICITFCFTADREIRQHYHFTKLKSKCVISMATIAQTKLKKAWGGHSH